MRSQWSDTIRFTIDVNDMLVASQDNDKYERVYRNLSKNFKLTSLGDVINYLDIQVERASSGDFFLNR